MCMNLHNEESYFTNYNFYFKMFLFKENLILKINFKMKRSNLVVVFDDLASFHFNRVQFLLVQIFHCDQRDSTVNKM